MIAAPITGPSVGPPLTATAYQLIAVPRASRLHRSLIPATALLIEAEPKKPAKKRAIKIEDAFLPEAIAIEKTPRQNIPGRMPNLRPQASETGAQKIGPKPNPRLVTMGLAITELKNWNMPDSHIQGDVQNGHLIAHAHIFCNGVIGRRGDA